MLFDPIARLARQVYAQLIAELLAQDITAAISKPNTYYRLHTGSTFVDFTAKTCRVAKEKRLELSGEIIVIESDAASQETLETSRCEDALLGTEGDDMVPTLTLELYNPISHTGQGPKKATWSWKRIRGLIIPERIRTLTSPFRNPTGLNAQALASSELLQLPLRPGNNLKSYLANLQRIIRRTLADIQAETQSRLVFGIGCIPMILIGIGLGIMFKGGHLLSAFGLSCIPAAILMVCIIMGRNIAKNLGVKGISGTNLMWAGSVLLVLLALAIYRKLLKN
jgi:hypothetical protein